MEKKNLLIGIFALISFVFILQGVSAYCAELTTYGATCQDVPFSQVDTTQPYYTTACSQTESCMTGTCENTDTGTCISSTALACNPNAGGVFYTSTPDATPRCQKGCCLMGSQASFTTPAGCDSLANDAGVSSDFDESITDEVTCVSLAFPEEEGACVFNTVSSGRTCLMNTKEECNSMTESTTFYGGFLCTNPVLGTNCKPTKDTSCLEDWGQVYFRDSCGNPANIYDSSKTYDQNPNYWNYLATSSIGIENGVVINIGDGVGNIGSATNGNCNYQLGSTCARYDRTIDPVAPALGDNICRNVNCVLGPFSDLFNAAHGRTPYHGETWCGRATQDGIQLGGGATAEIPGGNLGVLSTDFSSYNKTGNNPGDTEILFTCANGRIGTEVGAQYRSKICIEEVSDSGAYGAQFVVNKWQDCYYQMSRANCTNTELRSCNWVLGASVLKDANGSAYVYDEGLDRLVSPVTTETLGAVTLDQRPEASCVPKYPAGFDPSTDGSATDLSSSNICGLANRICFVNYSRGTARAIEGDSWYVSATGLIAGPITCLTDDPAGPDIETVVPGWEQNMTNLCMALGDCGMSVNYVGRQGANIRQELFQIITGNWTGGSNV